METKIYQSTEIDELFLRMRTLKGVIEGIEEQFYKSGRVLCKIKVNGMSLSPDDEVKFEMATREDVEILEVGTQSIENLIQESRESLRSYLQQLKEVSLKAAEALRAGVAQDANDMIRAIIDGTGWVADMLNQIRMLDPTYSGIQRAWLAAESEFLKVSKELLLAYERNDLVLVADNLEYEWGSSIEQWLTVLKSMTNSSLAPGAPKVDNSNE